MLVDITKLVSVVSYKKMFEEKRKETITRQSVYEKILAGNLTSVKIDGRIFVLLDEKSGI